MFNNEHQRKKNLTEYIIRRKEQNRNEMKPRKWYEKHNKTVNV